MKLENLESKLEYYNKHHKIEEIDIIENTINDDYEELKQKLYNFKLIYHFIFVFQNELDQEDLGNETRQKVNMIIERCTVRRNKLLAKEIFDNLKYSSIYKPYNYYYKRLVKLDVKGKLDYLFQLYKEKRFIYKNWQSSSFGLDSNCSEFLSLESSENPERKIWYLNFHSDSLFEKLKVQLPILTNAEVNNQTKHIEKLIKQSQQFKPSTENNYFDFNEKNMHEAYHIAQNMDFYSKLNISVYSIEEEIVIAYTEINKVLPYLKKLLKDRRLNQNNLVSQELYSLFKKILLDIEKPKGWFIAGVMLATGEIENEIKKFNYNFTQYCKELFGTEMAKKIRPYLNTSYNNIARGGKNIFSYSRKVAEIEEYCKKNNIEIDKKFSENAAFWN